MSTPVFSYREADFLDIGTATTPKVLPLLVVTQLDESPQAKTTERAYVPAKNATVLTTGYQTQFPFNTDEYEDDEVTAFILLSIVSNVSIGGMPPKTSPYKPTK